VPGGANAAAGARHARPPRRRRRPRPLRAVLSILAALALIAGVPVRSALAIFTKQVTVTANTVGTATSFPVCYRDAALADNPSSYWALNETSGTTAADSKGSNNATYRNGVSLGQPGALPDAINGKAATFDGTDDDVQGPNVFGFTGTASFSVEFWVMRSSVNENMWRPVVMKEDMITGPGRQGWGMWLGPENDGDPANQDTIGIERWNGNSQDGVGSYTHLRAGVWYHVAGTYDGAGLRIYVNGDLEKSAASTMSMNSHTVPLYFGSLGSFSDPAWFSRFTGSLDEVAIYSTALTATQIRNHYNAGRCYKDGVLADGPAAYWRLGEGAGGTALEGAHGYHGTYVGSPTLGQTGALNLDASTSVTFNGTTQYASIPYDSSLNPAQVTIEAWAKPTGGSGTARTIAASQDTNKGYLLGIGSDNKWRFTVGTGSATNVAASSSTVTLNSWAHLVGTYDGTTARLYVDGVQAGSTTTGSSINTTRAFGIGATNSGGSWAGFFPGSIDEVAVYTAALSQARIQAHYLLGRSYKDTVLDSSPVSFWRLGEGSGTSAVDTKGSNAGTYTNSPALGLTGALGGDADTSVGFNSTTQYVSVSDSASLRPSQISVEAWVKPDSATIGDFDCPLIKTSNDNWTDGYGFFYRSTGTLAFFINSWGGVAPAASIALDQWTHVVGTYDGVNVNLYLNGSLAASVSYSTAITHATNALYIGSGVTGSGAAGPPGYFWGGRVDDVAVYSRALSPTEAQLHYDSGRQ
jgi:hypothetical protein